MSPSSEKQTKVDHHYHDHLHDPVTDDEGDWKGKDSKERRKRRGPRGGVAVPFPEKLYSMLKGVESDGLGYIVSWQPHGRCFAVRKSKDFVESVMPLYFKQTKMTSFQRQLNLYGFSRLTTGPDRGSYYHEYFLRGRPDLCKLMLRTRIKGNGSKSSTSPGTEPNFYAMEFCSEEGFASQDEKDIPYPEPFPVPDSPISSRNGPVFYDEMIEASEPIEAEEDSLELAKIVRDSRCMDIKLFPPLRPPPPLPSVSPEPIGSVQFVPESPPLLSKSPALTNQASIVPVCSRPASAAYDAGVIPRREQSMPFIDPEKLLYDDEAVPAEGYALKPSDIEHQVFEEMQSCLRCFDPSMFDEEWAQSRF